MCLVDLQVRFSFVAGVGKRLVKIEGWRVLLHMFLPEIWDCFPVENHLRLCSKLVCLFHDVPVVGEGRVTKKCWVCWSSEEIVDVFCVFAQDGNVREGCVIHMKEFHKLGKEDGGGKESPC